MPDRFIETHVRQLPLFAPLPNDLLRHTLSAMQILRYEAGETVFKQSEATRGMYLLINGRADLIRADAQGNQTRLATLTDNQFINEKALYQSGRETATLVVQTSATILLISRNRLWEVVGNYPEIKKYIPIPVATAIRTEQKAVQEFDGQRQNERVLHKTRRHWWAFAKQGWIPALLFGIALMLFAFVPIPIVQIVACGLLGLLIPAGLLFYHYVEWRNDMLIITDQRVIHIERNVLAINTQKSEISLSRIHQVNAEINPKDPIARLLRYGTIQLRTAGAAGNIVLHTVPNVNRVQEIIFENRATSAEPEEDNQRNQIRADIERVIQGKPLDTSDADDFASAPPQHIFAPLRSRFTNADGDTVYRHHIIVWWRNILRPALLLLLSLIVLVFGANWGLGAFSGIIGIIMFFMAMLWFWWVDWDWRNDLFIIGDNRIRLIRKRPLWLQNRDDQILMESIDNVTSEKGGVLQNLFNYGDVRISLIGGDRGDEKWLESVPNPQAIQEEITKRQQRKKYGDRDEAERRRRQEIAEYLAVYHEMQQSGDGSSFPTAPSSNTTPTGYNQTARPPGVPRKRS